MASENFAGNIIVNLASLPDFLRGPILKKRMIEFFGLPESERDEVVTNALEAGPGIPFANFSRLFKTWLEILSSLPEGQRRGLFSAYVDKAAADPQKLLAFNLDGILGTFLELDAEKKEILSKTARDVIAGLDGEMRRRMLLIIPENAKGHLGL